MGDECLHPGAVGRVLELPDQPVHPGGGAAFAGGVDVDVAGDRARAQVGGDDEVADGVGDADGAGQLPGAGTATAVSAWARTVGSASSLRDSTGTTSVPSRRPSCRLANRRRASKRATTSAMPLSVARRVPAATCVADADPGLAHVVELQGAGLAVLEVADELAEDPGLVGVGDAAELLLHDRLGEHLGPGQVVQGDLAQLALVDLGGVLAGDGGDLVARW